MELLLESITKTQVGSMLVSVFTDAAGSTNKDTEIERGVCVCVGVVVLSRYQELLNNTASIIYLKNASYDLIYTAYHFRVTFKGLAEYWD